VAHARWLDACCLSYAMFILLIEEEAKPPGTANDPPLTLLENGGAIELQALPGKVRLWKVETEASQARRAGMLYGEAEITQPMMDITSVVCLLSLPNNVIPVERVLPSEQKGLEFAQVVADAESNSYTVVLRFQSCATAAAFYDEQCGTLGEGTGGRGLKLLFLEKVEMVEGKGLGI
ncbi:unnamed protein product, partial [Chrysoparadoxa australica]